MAVGVESYPNHNSTSCWGQALGEFPNWGRGLAQQGRTMKRNWAWMILGITNATVFYLASGATLRQWVFIGVFCFIDRAAYCRWLNHYV